MLDKLKKKLHEESLLMKVEAVTDNIHVNTKRHKMFVRLIQLCDESLENTDLVFAALRARLSDGLAFHRHLSVIKILWLIELLANYGPLVVLDFLPSLEKYLGKAAQYYAKQVDSAFFPALQKCEELLDLVKAGGPGGKHEAEENVTTTTTSKTKTTKTKTFSIEDAVRMCLTDLDTAIKKIHHSLQSKISHLGENGKYEVTGTVTGTEDMFNAQSYQQELLSLLESAMTSHEDQVDMVVLEDLLTNLQSSSEEKADVAAVFRALNAHLCFDQDKDATSLTTQTAKTAVQCRKVFEILNYFHDNGITDTDCEVFDKEELQKYATNYKFEVAGIDLGYQVRVEAARFLDLPIIGSFEEGGVNVDSISISFNGSLSRFDSDSD